jgi:hypothetical protein
MKMFRKLADQALKNKNLSESQKKFLTFFRGNPGVNPYEEAKAPVRRKALKPPKGYRPGIDPEFDYFNPPKMAKSMKKGGLVKKDRRDGLAQKGRTKGVMR